MDGPDVVWVTHPSFRNLDEEEELLVRNYFQSTRNSGGGSIETLQRVSTHQQTVALLIKFSDAASVARVCSRDHKLSNIFLSKPERFTSENQTLIVSPHSFSTMSSQVPDMEDDGSTQSWVVLDDLNDSGSSRSPRHPVTPSGSPTAMPSLIKNAKIEVYEYPEDCFYTELTEHFAADPFRAYCQTPEDEVYNEDTKTFIMQFTEPEAHRILSKPDQYFDDEDVDSMISVRRFVVPIKQVLLDSPKDLSSRFLKKHLKDIDVEKYETVGQSKRKFIVTFCYAADAEKFAQKQTIVINPTLIATVKLCEDTTDLDLKSLMSTSSYAPSSVYSDRTNSPPLTLTTNDFRTVSSLENRTDSTLEERSATPQMDVGKSLRADTEQTPDHTGDRRQVQHQKQDNKQTSLTEQYQSARPKFVESARPKFVESARPKFVESARPKSNHPPIVPPQQNIARDKPSPVQNMSTTFNHVEIDKFPTESPKSMFNTLEMHVDDFAGADWVTTKFQQSYDKSMDVFRFDMDHEDVMKLLGTKLLLFEGDEGSALSLRPLDTGKVITVTVATGHATTSVTLDKNHLMNYFGEEGPFCCKVKLLNLLPREADLELETHSAASLIVAIGEHTLTNSVKVRVVFAALSPRDKEALVQDKEDDTVLSHSVVVVESALSASVLKKLMLSKHRGNVIQGLSNCRYLVEFNDCEAAKAVLEQEILEFKDEKITVSCYNPAEENTTPDSSVDNTSTFIEIKALPQMKVNEMFQLLDMHFDEVVGEKWTRTKIEHCYDDVQKVFRFDMLPADISKLMSTKQFTDDKDPSTELVMEAKDTGKLVVITPIDKKSKSALSKNQLKVHFGPKGSFQSGISIKCCDTFTAEIELDTYSVSCLIVSQRHHTLKNGMVVEASFSGQQTENADKEVAMKEQSIIEQESVLAEDSRDSVSATESKRRARPTNAALASFIPEAQKTLLVTNLLDVDNQTLYFWIKSLTDIWPISIQFSADEERAIVKLPANSVLDSKKLSDIASDTGYHVHGEKLSVQEVKSTTHIQVICSSTKSAGQTIDKDTLEAYYSNPKYTGINDYSSLQKIKETSSIGDLPVFIVTYQAARDVDSVIQRKPHKQSHWRFDVAEYYSAVGPCNSNSLMVYPLMKIDETDVEVASQTPSLFIKGIAEQDLQTLKMYMEAQRRTGGGAIASCDFLPQEKGLVKVMYKDPKVTERVYYQYYLRAGLEFKGKRLEIELELPWLNDQHDKHRIRISGLTEGLDPEKLKFYLSAVSNNVVTQMSFNKEQTRAVAEFSQPLDYGKLLYIYHKTSLEDCPTLKIEQEPVADQLIATGNLSKEEIELPLEKLLSSERKKDVDVLAEEFEGGTDMWKITIEPEVLNFIIGEKRRIKGCKTLSIYSEFLGLHATSGVQRKSQELSNFVSDPLMLCYLQDPAHPGNQKFRGFLEKQDISLFSDGTITVNLTADKKSNRIIRKNWRILKQLTEKFINQNFVVQQTEHLTQQVFNKVKAELHNLFSSQQVVTKVAEGNQIAIAGEKSTVEKLNRKLQEMIAKFEAEIQEEKTTRQEILPNILDFQIEYLRRCDFFTAIKQKHKLKSVTEDPKRQEVVFSGLPASIEAAQKEIIALLPALSKSKVTDQKKPIFLKIFKTNLAESSIRQELLAAGRVQAVWTIENRTLSVYSENKSSAEKALGIINTVIWEAQYPSDGEFDDLERKLLVSGLWKDKIVEMCRIYEPLEIIQLGDKPGLSLAGLAQHKASVLEEIPYFFSQNVRRVLKFDGDADKINFVSKFRKEVFKEMESKHDVKIRLATDQRSIEIEGTLDNIANCGRSLEKQLKAVLRELHVIEDPARIQHIKEDPEFLETIGLKSSCLVVPHREQTHVLTAPDIPGAKAISPFTSNYTVTLQSGVVCEVKRGDITALSCDGIVNAANGDLQHVGGLAYAIIQKGGSSIQQECTDYVRKHGKLMEGQVMSSAPGKLGCKRIIHAVGPRWKNGKSQEEITLLNCIDNCFDEAKKYKMQSIAIPPISTGIFGYPLENAIQVIVDAIDDRERQRDYLPHLITLVDNKEDSLHLFERKLRDKYEKMAPKPGKKIKAPAVPTRSPSQSASATTVPTSKFTINDKSIKMASGLDIKVEFGDLVNSQEDSLVNSVGQDLNLANGKVAVALATKAGPQLQAACTALAPINAGEVKETDGFSLACKKVLHCSCPQWQGPQTVPILKQIVTDCLTKAASNGHISIAFPALGTGNLRYPETVSAQYIIEAIMEYSERNTHSSLTHVKIVIFHLDLKTKKGYEDELMRLSNSKPAKINLQPKASSSADTASTSGSTHGNAGMSYGLKRGSLKGSVTVNNTTVRIVHGDITEHKADVLVNSTDGMLSIQGQVAKALIAKAGQAVRDEVKALSLDKAPSGLWISSAGNLKSKHIFHINAHFMGQKTSGSWSKIISNCLQECDSHELESIAFPALGTGALGIPAKDMAKMMLVSVIDYINQNSLSCLLTIDVVIFQDVMVKDFVESMRKTMEKKDSWWKRLSIKVSQFIFGATADVDYDGGARGAAGGSVQSFNDDGVCKLDIYAASAKDIKDCKTDLESKLSKAMTTLIWKDKPTYAEDREHIGKLSQNQIRRLKAISDNLHVNLLVDQRTLDIKIVGRQADVYNMSEQVAAELKNIEKGLLEKKEEELIAMARQWEYQDEECQWTKFEPSVNKNLEEAYTKNASAIYTYETVDGDEFKIDMSQEKGYFKGVELKIRRLDLSKPQASELNLPNTWNGPLDNYVEFAVVPGTAEYQAVETAFMSTLGAQGKSILEVKRVQNPTLYKQYLLMRKQVAKKLGKQEDQIETTVLWHGTDIDTVSKITGGMFDRGYTGKNAAVYGQGTYFAKNSSYSAHPRYSQPNAQGHQYIIQTRVITGEWCVGTKDMKAAPYKPSAPAEQFDSVVDNIAAPTIFVVFHDAAAYPDYIIKFM